MKFIYSLIVFLFIGRIAAISQNNVIGKQSIIENDEFYNHKAKVQKTYAWIAVTSGIVLYGIGLSQSSSDYYIDNDPTKGYPPSKRTPYFIAGTIAELISIPFFISAKNNKYKASVSVKKESAMIFKPNININYPSIALRLKL